MTSVLAASDLDRTLIYSRNALALAPGDSPELACVEIYAEQPASFMTPAAAEAVAALAQAATFTPVTTRTPAQLARVTLPGRLPEFAVAANGGALIIGGERDRGWDARIGRQLEQVAPLNEVWDHVVRVCRPEWTSNIRNADGLFCYAVVDRSSLPRAFLREAEEWATARGWVISLQGRKLYWMPSTLTKSAAVTEIAERIGANLILAAGDSLLDRDLLECADFGIRPRHGELFDSGWSRPSVCLTADRGVRAGQEIVEWLLTTARRASLH